MGVGELRGQPGGAAVGEETDRVDGMVGSVWGSYKAPQGIRGGRCQCGEQLGREHGVQCG